MQSKSNYVTPIYSATDQTRQVDAEFQPGAVLGGRYMVLSLLGAGGMGVVYRVNQIYLGKELALKTIEKRFISDVTIRRFQQEARAVCAIDHPNIIAVHDFGLLDDQTPFLVMEVVNGESLEQRLKRTGYLPIDEAIPTFVQVCFGLAYSHDQGIVHRDIKPSNLMLLRGLPPGTEGSVKIVDFGIAKLSHHDGGEIQALTRTGEIFGSPLYMSPEQCGGERVDHRSDIYSLGCVLFESLTGTPPFVGENALFTMMQHLSQPPPTLREASLGREFPDALEKIVATMLAKSPDTRYQNLGFVAHYLGALSRGEVISYPAKSSQAKAQATEKIISMPGHKFYALLFGMATVSAAIAGTSGYLLHHNQSGSTAVAPRMAGDSSTNKVTALYSRIPTKGEDGEESIVFHFPQDQDLGSFEHSGVVKVAAGDVKYAAPLEGIVFQPSESFLQTPNNLKLLFQPNDLLGLNLKGCIPDQLASQIMLQVSRLTGLRILDLTLNNGINNDALGVIQKLRKLQVLNIWGTKINGTALAKLTNLKQLKHLNFGNCKGASDLLKVLKHNNQMEVLYLDNDPLTASDYKLIGSITGLRHLSVNTTDMHNADLNSLTSLTKLEELEAKDCPINKDAIPSLKIMVKNGLQKLSLSAAGFSKTDVALIKKLLPSVDFKVEDKDLEERAVRDFKMYGERK